MEENNHENDAFRLWRRDADDGKGKVCWGLLHTTKILDYLRWKPEFLLESMDQVIDLEWEDRYRPTSKHDKCMVKVRETHAGKGWKVGHLVSYSCAGFFVKVLLEKGLITPTKDGMGRSLSDMTNLLQVEFPSFESFQQYSPFAYARLKCMEFNEEQKHKMLLVVFGWGGVFSRTGKRARLELDATLVQLLPLEILKLLGKFLFTNNRIIMGEIHEA